MYADVLGVGRRVHRRGRAAGAHDREVGDHHGLPVDQRRGHGVHRRRLRVPGRLRRGRRAGRQAAATHKAELPHLAKVVTFDGTTDGDWVIALDDLAALGDDLPRRAPRASSSETADDDPPRPARDPDLHLRHDRPPQGRAAAPPLVGLRGRRHPGAEHPRRERPAVPAGCRWPTRSARCCCRPQLACGFATAIDGRVDKIVDNLGIVKPTFMGAAPAHLREGARPDRHDAGRRGRRQGEDLQPGVQGRPRGRPAQARGQVGAAALLKAQHALFDKLVFSKVRERFGGRVRFFISGAAALNQDIAEWFNAAGILILEGYGLTETSARRVRQPPRRLQDRHGRPGFPGSRGQARRGRRGPDPGPARHGRLPQPARGDRQGADRRRLAAHRRQGRARRRRLPDITGRIKDLFKTSGGKYIAPPAIESKFKAVCPYASQFMVFGNERNYVRRPGHPRPRRDRGLGRGERHRRRVVRRDRRLRRRPGDGPGLRRRAQQPSSTGGRPSRSGSSSTTT